MTNALQIYDFTKDSDNRSWYIVDDVVMGGRSNGNFYTNSEGHGVFEGFVSLENNGGFSSLRHGLDKLNVDKFQYFVLRIKGDGKMYQFRTKSSQEDYYSYIAHFRTTGKWQTVELPFNEMYPSFRGRKLDLPNYPGKTIEEIVFLIANKKEEHFKLEIESINLK
jgi:hypothetical protein